MRDFLRRQKPSVLSRSACSCAPAPSSCTCRQSWGDIFAHSASLLQTICATEVGIRAVEHCDDALVRLKALEQDLTNKAQKEAQLEILKRYAWHGAHVTENFALLTRLCTTLQTLPATTACTNPCTECSGRLHHRGFCRFLLMLGLCSTKGPKAFPTPRDRSSATKRPAPKPGPAQKDLEEVSKIVQLIEAGQAARSSALITPHRNRRDSTVPTAGKSSIIRTPFRTPRRFHKDPSHGPLRTPCGDISQHVQNNR